MGARGAAAVSGRAGVYGVIVTAALAVAVFVLVSPSNLQAAAAPVRIVTVGVGVLFVAAGLVGVHLRPHNPIGVVLVVSGYLYLIGRLQGAEPPALWLTASVANVAWQAAVFYVIYSFPVQRLRSPVDVVIVVAATVYTLVNNLFLLVTTPTRPAPGLSPASPFFVDLDPAVVEMTGAGLLYVGALFIAGSMSWLARRWLHASRPLRRALTPVYVAAAAVSTVALLLRLLLGVVSPTTDPAQVVSVGLLAAFALVPAGFLAGLLRARIARSTVADLVLQLGSVPSANRLRDALATALGDPDVEVLRWSRDAGAYVDGDRRPVAPGGDDGRAVTVLEEGAEPTLAILHDATLLDDPGLVPAVVTAARLTLDNELLEARLRANLDEVRASRVRIAAAADAAQHRIERDIHDGTQQQLVAAAMALDAVRAHVEPASAVREQLDAVAAQLRAALTELRELARGVHPVVLTQRGLGAALTALARRSVIPTRVDDRLARRAPPAIEAAAYFFASEAIGNAQAHSGASEIIICIRRDDASLVVEVEDDGVGGATAGRGSGMTGMQDRADTVGGRVEVDSPAGGPTRVTAVLPLG